MHLIWSLSSLSRLCLVFNRTEGMRWKLECETIHKAFLCLLPFAIPQPNLTTTTNPLYSFGAVHAQQQQLRIAPFVIRRTRIHASTAVQTIRRVRSCFLCRAVPDVRGL
jgi:hypothetical protein